MAPLKIDNLSKTYTSKGAPAVNAVSGVSLTIEDGGCLAFTGPSGSGKTTLLMMLAGLVEPTGGTITLGGRALNGVRPDKRNIAMVFQHDALYPHLSARKHLVLSLRGEGATRSEMDVRIGEVSEELGIGDCLDRKPGGLSGGQRRRVALARAMVRTPGLLVLDEPFAGVDEELTGRIRSVLKQRWSGAKTTVLVVTHDARSAADLGDRVVRMRNGRLESGNEPG